MKRTLTLLGLLLILLATVAFAQRPMDDANERAVHITQGPNITNITGESATINWSTSSSGANHVRYRVAGSNNPWQSAYGQGGGTSHSLQLTGLEPNRTYEWQILTRDGDVRTAGQFQTARNRHERAPDVQGRDADDTGYGRDRDRDADDRRYGDRGNNARGNRVPLYRSSNAAGNLHGYTTNAAEQNVNGFHAEGTTGYILSSQGPGTVPLYRMTGGNGDTLLTNDGNFRSSMQAHGYRDAGIAGYVSSSQASGTQPLYQLSNASGDTHFYTTLASERQQFLSQGWKDQGAVGYIWSQQ